MRILGLGATGVIGRELVPRLLAAGHEVYVTSRRPSMDHGVWGQMSAGLGPNLILGDAQDEAFLRGLLRQNWDVILDFMVYDTARFRTRLAALLDASGQYIFTSSARVFAGAHGAEAAILSETSPRLLEFSTDRTYLATEEYALSKARQEDLLRASGPGNWTILRPYITFGPSRLQLGPLEREHWLYRALQGRSIVFCREMLERLTTLTDAADVARMILPLVGTPAAMGEDFNLTNGLALTWRDVLDSYLDILQDHLGARPRVCVLGIEDFLRCHRAPAQVRYDRLYDRRFDPAKISRHFDLSTVAAPLPALRARLAAELAEPKPFPHDWQMEAFRDRASGERAARRELPASSRARLSYLARRFLPETALWLMRLR